LSDSTIYMAYYTIAPYIHGPGDWKGTGTPPHGIKPEQMTDGVWDFIFLGKEEGLTETSPPRELLQKMRNEFLFWYPMDCRCSGKDLISNHLSMCLYNHAAIWDSSMMPRSFFCNGHILINGEKMAKSRGNFITILSALEQYSTDAFRLALAEAGDSIDDANFAPQVADKFTLKLYKELEWFTAAWKAINTPGGTKEGPFTFFDHVFDNSINKAIITTAKLFEKMQFRAGVQSGFHDLQNARDEWRNIFGCGTGASFGPLHKTLLEKFMRTQLLIMAPIIPHWSEYIWSEVLGESGPIVNQRWPTCPEVSFKLEFGCKLLNDSLSDWRKDCDKKKGGKKKEKATDAPAAPPRLRLTVFVMTNYNPWQTRALEVAKEFFDATGAIPSKNPQAILEKAPDLAPQKSLVMQFLDWVNKFLTSGVGPWILNSTPMVDQMELFTDNLTFIATQLGLAPQDIELVPLPATPAEPSWPKEKAERYKQARVYQPSGFVELIAP